MYRVLVVDDFEPWRRHVRSALETDPRWHIVGEANDGPDAVEKATALQPDVILLDVGLPSLNGIEAARRILARDPSPRILFVSEHRSWDIAKPALDTGARGYIVKSCASRDLIPAMDAIVDGQHFVSAALGDPIEPARDENLEPTCHEIAFYPDENALVEDYARVAQAALEAGNTFVLLTGSVRREQLPRRLRERGVDVDHAVAEGQYCIVDVPHLLARFMVDGWPDEKRFWKAATSLVAELQARGTGKPSRVIVCGECAPTLLNQGHADAALRVEQLWEEFSNAHHIDTVCGYLTGDRTHDQEPPTFRRIRALHARKPRISRALELQTR